MKDDFRPIDFLALEREAAFASDDTPCMDCPNRTGSYCEFYFTELDEPYPGVFIPCDECDDDSAEDEY